MVDSAIESFLDDNMWNIPYNKTRYKIFLREAKIFDDKYVREKTGFSREKVTRYVKKRLLIEELKCLT